MAIIVGGAGGGNPDADLFLRITEDLYGTANWLGANSQPNAVAIGSYDRLGPDPVLLGVGSGGNAAFGERVTQMTSAGGATQVRRGGTVTVPLSRRYQAADSLPLVLQNIRPRSYLFSIPVRVTALGAGTRGEVCLSDADNGVITQVPAATRAGPTWMFDQTINAGRLTPAWRQANAGALTVGPDTGVSILNAWHLVGIKYSELATGGRVDWLLDGAIRFSIAGDVNMPVFAGGGTQEPGWCPMLGLAQVAGLNAQFGNGMYEVRYIG